MIEGELVGQKSRRGARLPADFAEGRHAAVSAPPATRLLLTLAAWQRVVGRQTNIRGLLDNAVVMGWGAEDTKLAARPQLRSLHGGETDGCAP